MTVEVVLDSSAVLALIHGEPGGEAVRAIMSVSVVSAVNLAEILTKLTDSGTALTEIQEMVSQLPIESAPFDQRQAWVVSTLRARTRERGLSLADNACLALAQTLGCPAWTADRVWADLDLDIEVKLIR